MAAFIKRFPIHRSEASSSVPATKESSSHHRYHFPASSSVIGAEILEKNLYEVLRDKFSESEVKLLVSAIHTPIDKNRFSKSTTNLPATFRLKREENGTVTLFIHGKTLIGSGTYKKVKDAVEVTINSENECTTRDIVVQRVRKHISSGVIRRSIDRFERIQKNYHESQSQERFKVGPGMRYHRYQSKDGLYRIELTQVRLDTNLEDATDLTTEEKLKVIIDAIDGISQIHQAGYVHCDVKPNNIFIDYKGMDNERAAYVSDLDLLIRHGIQIERQREVNYFVWDHLAENGIFTRNTDFYGLAITAVGAFFPKSVFNNDDKSILAAELKKSPEKILVHLLKKERPPKGAFKLFKVWFRKGKRKSKTEIRAKLEELFPIELRLINIIKREFTLSLEYNRRVQKQINLCKKNNTQPDLIGIVDEVAKSLHLSTVESLKSEFIEMLRSLEGHSHAASSVSDNT